MAKNDRNWYYFWQSGSAATGWTKIDGSTYFFITSGSRIGQMCSGWMMLNGQKFYLGTDGQMRTGWNKMDGKWYYFWQSGPAATGWTKIDRNSYFFLTSGNIGEMMTGWMKLNGQTYYLGTDGSMRTGWKIIDNKQYYFWSSGAMRRGLVYTDRPGCGHYLNSSDKKYYYYFNTNEVLITDQIVKFVILSITYIMKKDFIINQLIPDIHQLYQMRVF